MPGRYLTKPGDLGTLNRYGVQYEEGTPRQSSEWRCWAYSTDHALSSFEKTMTTTDYQITNIRRLRSTD